MATRLSLRQLQSAGRRAEAVAGNHGQASVHMERDHEGPYRCSRIDHPRCHPDVRADVVPQQQRGELLWPGVWTKLPLLSVRPLRSQRLKLL